MTVPEPTTTTATLGTDLENADGETTAAADGRVTEMKNSEASMAVLTEAIEAEGEAEAVTAVMQDALVIVTAALAGLVHVLGLRIMIVTTVHRVVRIGVLETMTVTTAVIGIRADEARRQRAVVNRPN